MIDSTQNYNDVEMQLKDRLALSKQKGVLAGLPSSCRERRLLPTPLDFDRAVAGESLICMGDSGSAMTVKRPICELAEIARRRCPFGHKGA